MQDEQRTKLKTFELVVSVDGVLDVPMEDWPNVVKDGIQEALERASDHVQLPLVIVDARYKTDSDFAPDAPGHHYIHVIASEVIAADSRTVSPERLLAELPDEIKKLLN